MNENTPILKEILDELKKVNTRLDKMTDNGKYEIWDICSNLEDVKGEISNVVNGIKDLK